MNLVVYSSNLQWQVTEILLPVLWGLLMRMSVAQTDDLEQVLGEAVLRALEGAKLTVKEAAAIMRIDESQLRHGLKGEKGYHLSLNRLARLPFASFWMRFSPALVSLLLKRHISDLLEDSHLKRSA